MTNVLRNKIIIIFTLLLHISIILRYFTPSNKTTMKNLTIHQRINFKSHFNPEGLERIKRVDYYGHSASDKNSSNPNYKSFEIPFWGELQSRYQMPVNSFKSKF